MIARGWLIVALAALVGCGHTDLQPEHNVAFATAEVFDPTTLGSDLSAADALCTSSARAAGLAGTFVAYMSTSKLHAPDRLGNARGWLRTDGAPIVDSVADLVAGRLYHPIDLDQFGNPATTRPVAVGSQVPGSFGDQNCTDWTSAGVSYVARYTNETIVEPVRVNAVPCSMLARLYCFGTDFTAPLAVTPVAGRRMFVTVQAFRAGGGLASADALCAQEASLAGVPGNFLAMLSTSTASAASRFDLAGKPWVRLDGVRLARDPLALVGGELETSPSVTSIGTFAFGFVLTGGAPGATGGSSCTDWTNPAATSPAGGLSYMVGPGATDGGAFLDCSGTQGIYCFEP